MKCKSGLIILTGILLSSLIFGLTGLGAGEETPSLRANEVSEAISSPSVENSKKDAMSIEEKLKQTISLDYKNIDLATVLRSLSWTYNLNIVISPDIKGKITIILKDITVKEALQAILTISGLVYSERAGIIYIAPGDPKVIEMESEVIFLNYISASEAQGLLRKLISPKGEMKISEVANSCIITDFSANIQNIKALLEKIDIPPQQVLIEAKIVDITSSDLEAIGIAYNVDYAPGHGIFGRSTRAPEELDATITMAEQSESLTGGQFVLNPLALKGLTINATIDALVKDGKANLLASPSIAVLNNQEARIVIGERYPVKERTQTTTGTTETTKFVDIGITLWVIPQINQDGYITMRIHPEVSSLYSSMDAGPRITTREADTTVRVKAGETLVIAGLIKQIDERSREKIPFLGDLPLLKFLFSRKEKKIEQKELAVFITPKILRSREERELLGKKKDEVEEVYVSLGKTGELTLVERIFESAEALDKNYGIESVRKDEQFRKAQALSFYRHIFTEFPDAERTPEAMYRAGIIYYKYLTDYKKAKEIFSRLISDHSDSPFARNARKLYKKLDLLSKGIKGPKPLGLKTLRGN